MARPDESSEEMFKRTLHMGEHLARTLTAGGISTLEELAYIPIDELLGIQELAETDAQLFRQRAREYLLVDVMERPES